MSEVTCKSGLTEAEKSTVFWASFLALFACAVGFTFRVMTMGNWINEFGISGQEAGGIFGASLWPIAITMILFSLIVDKVGYKPSIYIAFGLQAVSVILCATAGNADALWWGSFCAGLGHGIVEAVINPACSSMYTEDKSTKLNVLHAAWPAGMVVGSIFILPLGVADSAAGVAVVEGASGLAWRTHSWWMMIPVVIYGVMFIKSKFPIDERVHAKVPYRDMLKEVGFLGAFIAGTLLFYEIYRIATKTEPSNLLWMSLGFGVIIGGAFGAFTKGFGKPLFFFLCVLMVPLATTELGTDAWIKQLMTPQMGDYAGWAIALSAFIMMILRFQAGVLLHKFNPPIVLCISSVFSMLGLLTLAGASGFMVFVAFVLYAVGQTFYWPTVLGLVSEQFPKGGALTLNTVSAIGLLSVGIIGTPIMGAFYDSNLANQVKEISPEIYEASQSEKTFFSATYTGIDTAKAQEAATAAGLGEKFSGAVDNAGRGALKTTALAFPLVMLICFALIAFYYKSKGGYKPIVLDEEEGDNKHGDPEGEPIPAVEL
ncbi:MAG: MFS transporter [Lentisphaerales bacterium]|nr:MFS transporter [Lentisphaerales bacterium]